MNLAELHAVEEKAVADSVVRIAKRIAQLFDGEGARNIALAASGKDGFVPLITGSLYFLSVGIGNNSGEIEVTDVKNASTTRYGRFAIHAIDDSKREGELLHFQTPWAFFAARDSSAAKAGRTLSEFNPAAMTFEEHMLKPAMRFEINVPAIETGLAILQARATTTQQAQ